jgi:hypothetical protein
MRSVIEREIKNGIPDFTPIFDLIREERILSAILGTERIFDFGTLLCYLFSREVRAEMLRLFFG